MTRFIITLMVTLLAFSGFPDGVCGVSAKNVEPLPAVETQQAERRVEPEYYHTRLHLAPVNTAQVRTDSLGSKDQVTYSQTSVPASAIYLDRVGPVHPQPGRPYYNEFSINVAPINNAQYTAVYYPNYPTPQPQDPHREQKNNH